MKLTEKEERMLKGDMGRGVQCAMEVLVKMGELYGAEEFVEVKKDVYKRQGRGGQD